MNLKTYELKNSFRLGQTAQGNHRSAHRHRWHPWRGELHFLMCYLSMTTSP